MKTQLFSWRIGQAQAAKGAAIISTNTDGLYSVMEKTLNDRLLAIESESIGVEIEPEPMFLISKDTNNRIEMSEDLSEVLSTSGGTVGCRMGPNPTKSLAHPAILDWALSEYLVACAKKERNLSIDTRFDWELGMEIMESRAKTAFPDTNKYLCMFQNVLASSPGSISYIYGTTDGNPYDPIVLQHYNRAFITKDDTQDTIHLWQAVAKTMTPAEQKTWKTKKTDEKKDERIASVVLSANGENVGSIRDDMTKRIVSKKVTNIEPDWYIRIENRDLYYLPDEAKQEICDSLDIEKYVGLLRDGFEANWMNVLPKDPDGGPDGTREKPDPVPVPKEGSEPDATPNGTLEEIKSLVGLPGIAFDKAAGILAFPSGSVHTVTGTITGFLGTDAWKLPLEFDAAADTMSVRLYKLPLKNVKRDTRDAVKRAFEELKTESAE